MSGLIVHEWLAQRGGSERVVDSMNNAFPDAPTFTLWNDAPSKYTAAQESWLARTPLRRHKAAALPFLPWTWRHFIPDDLSPDWLLVSSHLFAHHVRATGPGGRLVPKYVYVHTPARYIWNPELDPRGQNPAARAGAALLRPLDHRRAQEADSLAANSQFVRDRIRTAWHRDAQVIYPPVDVTRIQQNEDWASRLSDDETRTVSALPSAFFLGASRFVSYKALDLVIRTAAAVGMPAVIAGSGPEEAHLRQLAEQVPIPVTFVLAPSDALLYTLYEKAELFIFPPIEDFGIMPVEAMAAGCPVLVNDVGGAAESAALTGGGHSASILKSLDRGSIIEDVDAARSANMRDAIIKVRDFDASRFEARLKEWVHD